MTTTPTLYVNNGEGVIKDINNNTFIVPFRPATHDERLAGMPRCGSCAKFNRYFNPPNKGECTPHGIHYETFGCLDHKEKQ